MELHSRTENAQKAAIRYLTNFWNKNGAFLDFNIEGPGISDEWVTAYVGRCLLSGKEQAPSDTIQVLKEAVLFLNKKIRQDGGWGFNGRCGTDCDSTANAILFLEEMGEPVSEHSFDCLRKFQREDGGFSTYLIGTKKSWEISHLDVTALALSALAREKNAGRGRAAGQAEDYLKRQLTAELLPSAYWWNSIYYGPLAVYSWLMTQGVFFPRDRLLKLCLERALPESAFDTALLAELLIKLSCKKSEIEPVIRKLLSFSDTDGGFPGAGILRVTKSSCLEPWRDESGYVSISDEHVFTTAEVARALGSYLSAIERGDIK